MGNICLKKTFINGYKSLFFFSEFGNGIPQNIVTTSVFMTFEKEGIYLLLHIVGMQNRAVLTRFLNI